MIFFSLYFWGKIIDIPYKIWYYLTMKKLSVLIGISVLLFFSCITTTTIFDDSIPVEKTARILLTGAGNVTEYNGIGYTTDRSTIVNGKDILFRYNFLPQKEYFFYLAEKNNTYGLSVYAYNYGEKKSGIPREINAHFVGFAPFLNIRQSS